MSIWLDYSFARPDLAIAKGSGAVGVIRYLAPPDPNNAKILTPGERDAILAAGLDLALVYESYAARALEGAPAGAQDALIALAGARALGYPQGACLYFAVDTDTTDMAAVSAYFGAVRPALAGSYAVGVYGSYAVVTALLAAGLADFGWQTVAWSGGQRTAQAVLYQNGAQWFNGAADVNEVTGHVGSWLNPTTGGFLMALSDTEQTEALTILRRLSFGLDPGGNVPFSSRGEVVSRLRSVDAHTVALMNLPALTAALNAKVAAAEAKALTESDVEQALRDVLMTGVGNAS